jgi:hypothetical protein
MTLLPKLKTSTVYPSLSSLFNLISDIGVFNNRVLRKTFWRKRDEVTGKWKRLQNEKLYALYCSLNIIPMMKSRRMKWVEHVACMGDRRDANRGLKARPEKKRLLGRPWSRSEDNIKMDPQEMGW